MTKQYNFLVLALCAVCTQAIALDTIDLPDSTDLESYLLQTESCVLDGVVYPDQSIVETVLGDQWLCHGSNAGFYWQVLEQTN